MCMDSVKRVIEQPQPDESGVGYKIAWKKKGIEGVYNPVFRRNDEYHLQTEYEAPAGEINETVLAWDKLNKVVYPAGFHIFPNLRDAIEVLPNLRDTIEVLDSFRFTSVHTKMQETHDIVLIEVCWRQKLAEGIERIGGIQRETIIARYQTILKEWDADEAKCSARKPSLLRRIGIRLGLI